MPPLLLVRASSLLEKRAQPVRAHVTAPGWRRHADAWVRHSSVRRHTIFQSVCLSRYHLPSDTSGQRLIGFKVTSARTYVAALASMPRWQPAPPSEEDLEETKHTTTARPKRIVSNDRARSPGGGSTSRSLLLRLAGCASALRALFPASSSARVAPERAALLSAAVPYRRVTLPLQLRDGVYCLVYSIDGSYFRGVIDTGSPFLTISTDGCGEWNCWSGQGSRTVLEDTFEQYATQDGWVQWRAGDVSFSQLQDSPRHALAPGGGALVFGVFRSMVAKGGQGDQSLIGLVKHTNAGIRPSLLGQTEYRSFLLDFASHQLTLSMDTVLQAPGTPTIPLIDFRALMGAPSQQYVARVRSLSVNGQSVNAALPIYAMIDSGSTGLFMTHNLFYPLQEEAHGWRSAAVEFECSDGGRCQLTADRSSPLFLCFPTRFPWFDETRGYLVVLGMAFLRDTSLAIDMDASLMQICQSKLEA